MSATPQHETTWRHTFYVDPYLFPELEGARGAGERRGEVGMACFEAGWYPACSKHGALNRVSASQPAVWRCLVEGCNVGTTAVVAHG